MEATTTATSPLTGRLCRRRRPGTATAAAVLACGLLAATSFPPSVGAGMLVAAQGPQQQATMTIKAVPDSTQLSTKGTQAGCDHYRHGYMGLALCVNFYDDNADGAHCLGLGLGLDCGADGSIDIDCIEPGQQRCPSQA